MIPPEVFQTGSGLHRFLSTTDAAGTPRPACAGTLAGEIGNRVCVRSWFCPQTIANLRENRRCSIVVWDPARDFGYQLLGAARDVEEQAMLDGFSREELERPPVPQVEYQLTVEVERVLEFRQAPHADTEVREQ